jgi:hypothetical protein
MSATGYRQSCVFATVATTHYARIGSGAAVSTPKARYDATSWRCLVICLLTRPEKATVNYLLVTTCQQKGAGWPLAMAPFGNGGGAGTKQASSTLEMLTDGGKFCWTTSQMQQSRLDSSRALRGGVVAREHLMICLPGPKAALLTQGSTLTRGSWSSAPEKRLAPFS